ncbi:MAG: hypothetical protein GY856_12425 [bacterium]|nr:hypothetical protein [bacterium]
MKRIQALSAVAMIALLTTGCLIKHTRHTLYLDPDGGVSWMVIEKDIRSVAEEAEERDAQESEYLDLFAAGRHPVAVALEMLGGANLRSSWLRDRRPYATVTEAEFGSVETLVREFFAQLAVPGEVELSHEGSRHELVMTVLVEDEGEEPPEAAEELLALVEDAEAYRIVLTAGEFVDAEGFTLYEDDTVAMFDELTEDELAALGGVLTLRLSWTD